MKKFVTLLVLAASFSAVANDLCQRCLNNCTKDPVFCREFVCANRCGENFDDKSEITIVDQSCFYAIEEEYGISKAEEICQIENPDLEIDYKDLMD